MRTHWPAQRGVLLRPEPGQNPARIGFARGPVFRPSSGGSFYMAETDGFPPGGIHLTLPEIRTDARPWKRSAIVPRYPWWGIPRQLGGMPLQLGELQTESGEEKGKARENRMPLQPSAYSRRAGALSQPYRSGQPLGRLLSLILSSDRQFSICAKSPKSRPRWRVNWITSSPPPADTDHYTAP